jgi:hypothetical protein
MAALPKMIVQCHMLRLDMIWHDMNIQNPEFYWKFYSHKRLGISWPAEWLSNAPLNPSGYFMYHEGFNVKKKFYILPTECVCVFCVDLRTNSVFFSPLCSINWLVFMTRKECAYCAVRTELLYTLQGKFKKSSEMLVWVPIFGADSSRLKLPARQILRTRPSTFDLPDRPFTSFWDWNIFMYLQCNSLN